MEALKFLTTHEDDTMSEGSGPRSGKNAPKKSGSSKGKAKMSQAAWDQLSNRQKERDYGGSRFESKGSGSRNSAKEAGHQDAERPSRAGGHAGGKGR